MFSWLLLQSILTHGSTAGLTDFAQIHQTVIVENLVGFIVKTQVAWYDEHMRSFELKTLKHLKLLLQSDLNDAMPLAVYSEGGESMVTLRRCISVPF